MVTNLFIGFKADQCLFGTEYLYELVNAELNLNQIQ